MRKFPPKGYLGNEHPLIHDFEYNFSLSMFTETQNTVICPLVCSDKLAHATPATIDVNPKNSGFAINATPNVLQESIIPEMQLAFSCSISKLAIETDAVRAIKLNYMFLYTAFLNRLDASDTKSGDDVEGILGLSHETDESQVFPLWSTTDAINGSTMPANQEGNASAVIETVAFDKEKYFDALTYYENASMLRLVAPSMKSVILKRDYPYTRSGTRPMKPICKFMNVYSFCGIMFHLSLAGKFDQYTNIADITALTGGHVDINLKCRLPEWNKAFNQEATG